MLNPRQSYQNPWLGPKSRISLALLQQKMLVHQIMTLLALVLHQPQPQMLFQIFLNLSDHSWLVKMMEELELNRLTK